MGVGLWVWGGGGWGGLQPCTATPSLMSGEGQRGQSEWGPRLGPRGAADIRGASMEGRLATQTAWSTTYICKAMGRGVRWDRGGSSGYDAEVPPTTVAKGRLRSYSGREAGRGLGDRPRRGGSVEMAPALARAAALLCQSCLQKFCRRYSTDCISSSSSSNK